MGYNPTVRRSCEPGESFCAADEIPWRIPKVGSDMLPDMSDIDQELLARYNRQHAEDAFAELVRRHLGLVYSAALRQVRSPQLAEEVAQSAFIDLARSATRLKPDTILTAWLYQVTRRTAIDVVRREASRQLREQIATEMNAMNATAADWTHIEPLLDDAMHALDDTDRAAVLLRYFENKSLREVGATLGTSENAAQKRLGRAVERLREFFAKSVVTVGTSGLVVVISANAVQAAPIGLAVTFSTAAVVAGTTLTTTTTGLSATLINLMASTKIKTVGVIAAIAMGTGTCVFLQERTMAAVRNDNRVLDAQVVSLAGTRAENERLARLSAESQSQMETQRQRDELLRLREQVAGLRNQLAEQRRSAVAMKGASINGAPLDAPGTSFRPAEARDVGTRTPMALLQTRYWAGHTANAERFRQLWVEAPNVSEREKKRGLMFMERFFKRLSGDTGLRDLDDYQELRLLQQIPSEDGTEIQLVAQLRGKVGWQPYPAHIRRVGDEWRFVMLMSPNELTPSIPE
jgi:RNA polymerase sigma factor (sigma-70 family)